MPSHDNAESGIMKMGKLLAQDGCVDKVDFLQRIESIDKLASGGHRDLNVHLNSITVDESMQVSGDVVLLIDDVTTSHNSLLACKQILLKNGAEKVSMFALGQAID